ncbi:hypothetical protein SUBVAR_06906 [Subdoligranulum variabile DSM 15176]|uniref:Uncharacterized protein n=1 Tax=Subdoligranulum variabile DSM 15176 TaxID=411471 RepID=D1PR78_9FIRM|nr:hypothetical protein SUBVAR_06906 [Subdoligranulum variabile DSM 15176]
MSDLTKQSLSKSRKSGRCKAEGCSTPLWNAKPDNAADAALAADWTALVCQGAPLTGGPFGYLSAAALAPRCN